VVQPNLWQRGYFLFLDWMPWSGLVALVVLVVAVALVWLAAWRRRVRGAQQPSDVEPEDTPALESEADPE
jgi:hypothetical protein